MVDIYPKDRIWCQGKEQAFNVVAVNLYSTPYADFKVYGGFTEEEYRNIKSDYKNFFDMEPQPIPLRIIIEEDIEEKIKVFKVNDCDWYAGEDLESIKDHIMWFTGYDADEEFDDPYELSESEMRQYTFTDIDGTTRDFKEELKKRIKDGDHFPCFFASTEY
jgi:hypothetical protein